MKANAMPTYRQNSRPMKNSRHSTRQSAKILAGSIAALLAVQSAQAATYYWDTTTTGLWATGANWSNNAVTAGTTGVVPLATDFAFFNQSSVNGAEIIQLGANTTIGGITFANTGTTLLDSDSATPRLLTLGSGGITINSGAGAVTIGDATNVTNILLGAAQTWANNSSSSFTVLNGLNEGGNLLTINGSGNTAISGVISNGSLTTTGTGTLTLNGSAVNTYTGATTVNAGTLALDFANLGTPTNLINSGSALVFGGGAVTIKGLAGANATSQTFASTTVNAGGGSLLIDPNNGTSTTVALNSLGTMGLYAAGSSLVLGKAITANTGTVAFTTTTNKDATGIYGGRIVFANGTANTGYDWATTASVSSPYTLSAYSGYTALAASGTDTNNSRITANNTPSGNITTNSLKIENPAAGQSLALGTNTLTLTSGGLLSTGTNAFTISGTATTGLTGGSGSGGYDLIIHQYNSGGLTISAAIGDNAGNATNLTKIGSGTLNLGSGLMKSESGRALFRAKR